MGFPSNAGRTLIAKWRRHTLAVARDIGVGLLVAPLSAGAYRGLRANPAPSCFLTPAEAVGALVDGHPWLGTRPHGKPVRMMFNRDGTGSFEGRAAVPTTWTVRGDDLCIDLGSIVAVECVRFRNEHGGLAEFEDDTLIFTLFR